MELSLNYSSLLVLKEAESNDEPSADGRLIRVDSDVPLSRAGASMCVANLFSLSLWDSLKKRLDQTSKFINVIIILFLDDMSVLKM